MGSCVATPSPSQTVTPACLTLFEGWTSTKADHVRPLSADHRAWMSPPDVARDLVGVHLATLQLRPDVLDGHHHRRPGALVLPVHLLLHQDDGRVGLPRRRLACSRGAQGRERQQEGRRHCGLSHGRAPVMLGAPRTTHRVSAAPRYFGSGEPSSRRRACVEATDVARTCLHRTQWPGRHRLASRGPTPLRRRMNESGGGIPKRLRRTPGLPRGTEMGLTPRRRDGTEEPPHDTAQPRQEQTNVAP